MKINIKNFFGRIGQKVKDHRNDLFMIVGTAGILGGTVLLCKETLKAPAILDAYKEAKKELESEAEVSEEPIDKKELTKLRAKTAGKMVLNFLPGGIVEVSGIGMQWNAYGNVKTACIGIGAAYAGLQSFVENYRAGVREKYGEDADKELAYGMHKETVVKVAEDGTETTEEIEVYPEKQDDMPSIYARYFAYPDATAAEKSMTYNKHFLTSQEEAANRLLRAHKKVMLNDVYDMLGVRRSVAGNRVGWIYDKKAPIGDNRIDFRIQEVYRKDEDGEFEKVLMIDPNVDGPVEEKAVRLGLMDR